MRRPRPLTAQRTDLLAAPGFRDGLRASPQAERPVAGLDLAAEARAELARLEQRETLGLSLWDEPSATEDLSQPAVVAAPSLLTDGQKEASAPPDPAPEPPKPSEEEPRAVAAPPDTPSAPDRVAEAPSEPPVPAHVAKAPSEAPVVPVEPSASLDVNTPSVSLMPGNEMELFLEDAKRRLLAFGVFTQQDVDRVAWETAEAASGETAKTVLNDLVEKWRKLDLEKHRQFRFWLDEHGLLEAASRGQDSRFGAFIRALRAVVDG